MSNFTWTNFKPFVITYLVLCILGYFLSPGIQSNINYKVNPKKTYKRQWSQRDLDMIYGMYFDKDLIELREQIELDTMRYQGTM